MAVSVFMGSVVLQVYAEPLFTEAVPSMNSNQCSILLAMVYLAASSLCAVLLDKLGRKVITRIYIPLTVYPRRGSRGISDIHPHFTKIT
jgi:hypothetical protein